MQYASVHAHSPYSLFCVSTEDHFFFFNAACSHPCHAFHCFLFLHNRCCWVCLITVPHPSARRYYFVVFGPAKKWCNSGTTFPGWFFVCWKTGSKLGIGMEQAQELLCLKRHIKGLVEVSLSSWSFRRNAVMTESLSSSNLFSFNEPCLSNCLIIFHFNGILCHHLGFCCCY